MPRLLLSRQGAHKSQEPGSSASQESAYGTVREGDTWGGVLGRGLFADAQIFKYRWYSMFRDRKMGAAKERSVE